MLHQHTFIKPEMAESHGLFFAKIFNERRLNRPKEMTQESLIAQNNKDMMSNTDTYMSSLKETRALDPVAEPYVPKVAQAYVDHLKHNGQ